MKKILLVDDNLENLELLKIVFELDNFEVRSINSARLIQSAISSFNPSVILMDIMLGEANGIEVCHQLKTSAISKEIPIILMSASNLFTEEKKESSLANDFIPKPFDIDELVNKVNEQLTNANEVSR